MGEVTKDVIIAKLEEANPQAPRDRVVMYADCYLEYSEATRNIDQHGAIVANPRTGAPMENPYLKVRDKAFAKLRKIRLNTADLWGD